MLKNSKELRISDQFLDILIKALVIKTYNLVMLNKEQLLKNTRDVISLLVDTTLLDEKIASTKKEIDIISELERQMVKQMHQQPSHKKNI